MTIPRGFAALTGLLALAACDLQPAVDPVDRSVLPSPGLTFAGRVVSRSDNRGIGDANVELHQVPAARPRSAKNGLLSSFFCRIQWQTRGGTLSAVTTSQADGTFRFEGLKKGDYYVRVSHPEHTSRESRPRLVPATEPRVLEIALGPASQISGKVSGLRRGLKVAVFAWPGHGPALRAAVDPNGNYVLTGLEPGTYALAVLADTGESIRARVAARLMTKHRVLCISSRGGDRRVDFAWTADG